MTLSTSLSSRRRRIPPRLVLVFAVALIAWVFSAVYTLLWNPEVALFKNAARIKITWSRKLDQQFTNKVVVFGGSSSTFSIDGGHALRAHQMPLANLALGAGMGAKVLTRFALPEVHRGDTLLMMIEPGLFYSDLNATQLGIQFSIAVQQPRLAHSSDDPFPNSNLPWHNYLAALRPGGYHFFTLIGKVLRRQPLYRYTAADFDESGHQQTAAKAPLITPRGKLDLSPAAQAWLTNLSRWCKGEGVDLVYALPWAYCPPDQASEFQKENAYFLRQIERFMPILHDGRLGAYSVVEHFADTSYHLNNEGAAIRTDELVDSLMNKRFWTADMLTNF